MIKLTQLNVSKKECVIWVNPSYIRMMWRDSEEKVTALDIMGLDEYENVKETPQQIIHLIKWAKEANEVVSDFEQVWIDGQLTKRKAAT